MSKKNNTIVKNKKAFFDYEIIDTWEAGLELKGHEVKSIRAGQVNLKGSYISGLSGEFYTKGIHITPWKAIVNRESMFGDRDRKVFLHKKTCNYLSNKLKEKGFSILALELYFKGSLIKLKVGLAKGKKQYQKKNILKQKAIDREVKIEMSKKY